MSVVMLDEGCEGVGAGDGPGSGSSGPRLITGPTMGQVRANHPPAARSRYGRVELSCRIRLDTRLDGCRVVRETPAGLGFGEAGLAVSGLFRFQPPIENGRPVEGQQCKAPWPSFGWKKPGARFARVMA